MANQTDPTNGGSSSTTTTASTSDGQIITVTLPSWLEPLRQVAVLIERYGSFPRAIFALITGYILNGLFDIIGVVAGSVLFAFDLIVGGLAFAQGALVGAFGSVGIDILGAIAGVRQAFLDVLATAGPAAPVLAALLTVGVLVLLYRAAIALGSDVPLLGALLEFLGLT